MHPALATLNHIHNTLSSSIPVNNLLPYLVLNIHYVLVNRIIPSYVVNTYEEGLRKFTNTNPNEILDWYNEYDSRFPMEVTYADLRLCINNMQQGNLNKLQTPIKLDNPFCTLYKDEYTRKLTRGGYLFTSYYARFGNLPQSWKDRCIPIQISRTAPQGFYGLERIHKLIPYDKSFRHYHTQEEKDLYTMHYYEQVIKNYDAIVQELRDLYQKYRKPLVLLCWEKEGAFCHRHLLRSILRREGINITELPKP